MKDEVIYYFRFSRYPYFKPKYGHGLAISAIQYLENLNSNRTSAFWTIEWIGLKR